MAAARRSSRLATRVSSIIVRRSHTTKGVDGGGGTRVGPN